MFGTRKIYAYILNGKLIIRVGGGYMSVDEFLDQYTPAELEKLSRNDPLKRFSEKVAVQKTIVGHQAMEKSPVRSPTKRAV